MSGIRKFKKKMISAFAVASLSAFNAFSALAANASESSQSGYQIDTSIENQVVQLSGVEKSLVIILSALVALCLLGGIVSVVLTFQKKGGAA
ncbi:MAG: hypothetical protein LBQ48_04530 [Oscillospiraceae bacterium]|jgi:hypothetical protein|nr:hypothetical protein [Oscillospiraceae bacterium]